jgi:hypothetical protein
MTGHKKWHGCENDITALRKAKNAVGPHVPVPRDPCSHQKEIRGLATGDRQRTTNNERQEARGRIDHPPNACRREATLEEPPIAEWLASQPSRSTADDDNPSRCSFIMTPQDSRGERPEQTLVLPATRTPEETRENHDSPSREGWSHATCRPPRPKYHCLGMPTPPGATQLTAAAYAVRTQSDAQHTTPT